ncbi:transporter [Jiangella ureilytica]|uniref:Transporter n=1 Tax=Jiangella ureilytica TaxID=2530374 RepID=A0A4R4RXU5_9ACTN|nr:transporter [Jiangella ureilytica]TDC53752.1 transporter [Jiangella ureilytica]
MTNPDELTPEESLRLIAREQAAVAGRHRSSIVLYYLPWGLALFIGFGLLALDQGPGSDGPWADLPDALPLAVLFVLMALAAAVTVVTSAREARRIGGESTRRGAIYGAGWALGFGTIFPLLGRFAEHLPEDQRGLLFGSISVAVTGVLYVAGAAIWLDWSMFVLGGWLLVVNLVGALAGPGWHSLVIAVAGGGALIVAGLVATVTARRAEP